MEIVYIYDMNFATGSFHLCIAFHKSLSFIRKVRQK